MEVAFQLYLFHWSDTMHGKQFFMIKQKNIRDTIKYILHNDHKFLVQKLLLY